MNNVRKVTAILYTEKEPVIYFTRKEIMDCDTHVRFEKLDGCDVMIDKKEICRLETSYADDSEWKDSINNPDHEIIQENKRAGKIAAVKMCREFYGYSLKEAKDHVEYICGC